MAKPSTYQSVSRDERWLIPGSPQALEVRPVSGGNCKTLVSRDRHFPSGHVALTADGEWLVYHDVDAAGKQALFRVATSGGKAERIADFPSNSRNGTIEFSPDGHTIIAAVGDCAALRLH